MLARLRGYEDDEAASWRLYRQMGYGKLGRGAIGAVSRNGVMSGYPDKTFRPQRDLTRAEAVAALQKLQVIQIVLVIQVLLQIIITI